MMRRLEKIIVAKLVIFQEVKLDVVGVGTFIS